ncbi:LytTR family DNA-binding domain-containing protein [Bacillus sp. DTU_2020_1000418_1_SI_GHA_SEK_038]|uniref:LytR/AlgR family response regulator transcription factor n=1 Tax=Bacillus sp. DTU_2020_1000418_1_SI_GHA_SEK_038 TaxID=3077585 RepID=UPI0028E8A65F|nr:LytTR family DNA-binding domain-containing protein [Bacillus sp. DTU_2020_1000418_1_SI_GHA_SEK_038]WNS76658.1 LytTR family DNA-binding domain-containing protein [Bacillus sp. DTU_2020_1000418_1_SI_GHA_SEK_038]
MNIHAMIAEDEMMARKELLYLLKEEKGVILTPHAETGEQLIELYSEHRPDVIFLDVEMPGLTGIEAARFILKQETARIPLFVFTTAYDEYAMDAFEVEAVDYLLKPYDETRFRRTMNRIRKSMMNRKNSSEATEKKVQTIVSKMLIDDGERMVVVSPDSIYYAVPNKRFLEIHTEDKVIMSRMTLQDLEDQLAGHLFFRAHRSYLVNLNHVLEITPWFNGTSNLTLKDKNRTKIPVSRSASKTIFEIFKG